MRRDRHLAAHPSADGEGWKLPQNPRENQGSQEGRSSRRSIFCRNARFAPHLAGVHSKLPTLAAPIQAAIMAVGQSEPAERGKHRHHGSLTTMSPQKIIGFRSSASIRFASARRSTHQATSTAASNVSQSRSRMVKRIRGTVCRNAWLRIGRIAGRHLRRGSSVICAGT